MRPIFEEQLRDSLTIVFYTCSMILNDIDIILMQNIFTIDLKK
jgi:hypothetical protein